MFAKLEADFSYVFRFSTVNSQKNKLNLRLHYSFVIH